MNSAATKAAAGIAAKKKAAKGRAQAIALIKEANDERFTRMFYENSLNVDITDLEKTEHRIEKIRSNIPKIKTLAKREDIEKYIDGLRNGPIPGSNYEQIQILDSLLLIFDDRKELKERIRLNIYP